MSETRATTFIPGTPSSSRSSITSGVMWPRSSRISGRPSSRSRAASKNAIPGPSPQEPCDGSVSSGGSSQNLTRPRKWSMRSRSNSSSSRSSRASHQAKPVARVLRPVEHRHAPALPLGMVVRRRRARDDRAVEERRMGDRVARVARDVERDVADQPDPTLVGVRLQRQPLALEARLGASLRLAGELHPLLEPGALRRTLVSLAAVVVRRAGQRQQALEAGERRARRVRRAELVGDVERQQLPPGLPRLDEPVDEPVGVLVEPPGRERGDMQQHAARATRADTTRSGRAPARSRRRARASTRSSRRRPARPARRSARRARPASPGRPRRRPRRRRSSARRRSASPRRARRRPPRGSRSRRGRHPRASGRSSCRRRRFRAGRRPRPRPSGSGPSSCAFPCRMRTTRRAAGWWRSGSPRPPRRPPRPRRSSRARAGRRRPRRARSPARA